MYYPKIYKRIRATGPKMTILKGKLTTRKIGLCNETICEASNFVTYYKNM